MRLVFESDDFEEVAEEFWDVALDGIIYDGKIDAAVFMNNSIAKSFHGAPGNRCVLEFESIRQPIRIF